MSDPAPRHNAMNLPMTVGTAVDASTAMLMGDIVAGTVMVDGVTASATLQVFGSSDGVTFHPLYGHDGQPAEVAVGESGGAVAMPDAVYPLRFVKLVAGTDLGAAATIAVALKS